MKETCLAARIRVRVRLGVRVGQDAVCSALTGPFCAVSLLYALACAQRLRRVLDAAYLLVTEDVGVVHGELDGAGTGWQHS